jgi:hypothetical protein
LRELQYKKIIQKFNIKKQKSQRQDKADNLLGLSQFSILILVYYPHFLKNKSANCFVIL